MRHRDLKVHGDHVIRVELVIAPLKGNKSEPRV